MAGELMSRKSRKFTGDAAYWILSRLISARLTEGQTATRGAIAKPVDARLETRLNELVHSFGDEFLSEILGRRVVDYGCGVGEQVTAIAGQGAATVFGIDVKASSLEAARELALAANVNDRCTFLHVQQDAVEIERLDGSIDLVFSINAFEHIVEVDEALNRIASLLTPSGRAYISFGPPWKHPYGIHLTYLRPLPWTHAIFSEETIMRVRNDYRHDGKRTFSEIHLSRMTGKKFLRHVAASPLRVAVYDPIAIRRCEWLASLPIVGEYFTSEIRCVLVKR